MAGWTSEASPAKSRGLASFVPHYALSARKVQFSFCILQFAICLQHQALPVVDVALGGGAVKDFVDGACDP